MSTFCCIFGFICAIILNRIQVGQCCITLQFTNDNNVLDISCQIPSFSGSGIWHIDGVGPKTSCSPTLGCSVTTLGNYTFSSDSNGIYAKISPFSSYEIGKVWECVNAPNLECNKTITEPTDSPTVATPEMSSTTNNIDQTTSSQNPSTASSQSEKTDTTTRTTTDNGLTSTSVYVTLEVNTPMKTNRIVGTIIAVVIPVGIFLIMVVLIICIIVRLRRSTRTKSTAKKAQKEPCKPKTKSDQNMTERQPNSSKDIYNVNERKSQTTSHECHGNRRIQIEEHTNSVIYPFNEWAPYSSHLYHSERPGMGHGENVPNRFMDYSFYQGGVTISDQEGRSRNNYYR